MRGDLSFQIMTIILVLTALVWWNFCLAYHIRSKWWKNKYGRNLMSVGAAIASLHTMLIAYVAVDKWSGWFTLIATILLFWSAYAAVRRVILMDQAQRQDNDRR
jgi:O-antigen/teichoic acid export membrane protein